MSKSGSVPISSIIQCTQAAHLSYCVASPFPARGGIMFVKPPGHLGTTILDIVYQNYPNFLLVSDLNSNNLNAMHESLFSGRYQTIAFKDMIKLYERNANSAANLEGTLRGMVEEGWTGATVKDMRIAKAPVRICVMGAMTPNIYANHLPKWIETGFARRFIWCHYKLAEPELVGDAIQAQKLRELEIDAIPQPQRKGIDMSIVTDPERKEIRSMLKQQPGMDGTPYNLMLRIAAVLKWKYNRNSKNGASSEHMKVIRDFSRTLRNEYVEVEI